MYQKTKTLLFGFFILSFTMLFALISCGPSNYLVGRGSNSISPIITLINNKTIFNAIYSPDGSTFGARAMAEYNPKFDFGTTSSTKKPGTLGSVPGINYDDLEKGYEQEKENWNNNQIRTLTFAIDAIGIGINLPNSIKKLLGNDLPIIDFDNLAKIYALETENSQFPTWSQFLKNEGIDKTIDGNKKPIPLAIEGGKNTSGKAEAFLDKIMKSKWFISQDFNDEQKANIALHNQSIIPLNQQVSDRDQEMFSKNTNTPNSVMYYSLGYIIKNNNQNIVTLSKISDEESDWGDPTIENAQNGNYPWIRPFNIIYQVTNKEILRVVKTLLLDNFQNLENGFIVKTDFVPLSKEQIDLQSVSYSIEETDQKLNTEAPNKFNYGLILG